MIALYYADHAPPQFHAIYAGHEASVAIETLEILAGGLPRRAGSLVAEWARIHQGDLRAAWDRAARGEPPGRIEPLP
ncbi:DUF4160 domain-containing protein [Nocardioides carbamazepini]|uniref:DUF4160 domain-containing protein n=1 Tax=Nocardioides carbamazepini TaxID=2854259 RepID=UPI00235702C7|nr:DUF4160 domain-containing protein [Nocardioides carbamazepini]